MSSGLLCSEHDEGSPDIALVIGEAAGRAHILNLLCRQIVVVCQKSLPREQNNRLISLGEALLSFFD